MVMAFTASEYLSKTLCVARCITDCIIYLNRISPNKYINQDFIIIAICNLNSSNTSGNNLHNELFNGLYNINYNYNNLCNINIKINKKDYCYINNNKTKYDNNKSDIEYESNDENKNDYINIKYVLTLPINNVYSMFMDIYTDLIFESKYYKINKENDETWCDKPLCDYGF